MANVPNQPQAPEAGALKIDLGPLISKAWALLKADLVLFIVGYLILGLIAGTVIGLIVAGPLMFGYLRVIQKRIKGEPAAIGDIFKGFDDFSKGLITMLLVLVVEVVFMIPVFVVILLLSFVPCVGWAIGAVVDLAAAIALFSAIYFVWPIAALSDVAPMAAIKNGFKFLQANLAQVVVLALVTGLIGGAGAIACIIGLFVTVPLAMIMCVMAYNEYYLPNAPK